MSDLLELKYLDEAARAAGCGAWVHIIAQCSEMSALGQSIIAHAKSLQKLAELEAENAWRPIEDAPQPRDWLNNCQHDSFVLARIRQPRDEDGAPDGPPVIDWAHVAYLTASGWCVGTRGFAGVHGFASFPLVDSATHFRPLPSPPKGPDA